MVKAYSYVRMSTDAQLKGDSLRRQLEKSRLYAAQYDLSLVEDFSLRDIGISAFKGANAESGALGRFLEAVRSKKIERGSYLLVESLDRISRQPPIVAFQLFTELMNNGIVLVTLSDNQVYTSEKNDFHQLITSIIVMSRAHEESAIKSQRISASWDNKRSKILERKLTSRGPAWLHFSSGKNAFELIEERAATVRRIFTEAVGGIGGYTISRRLNEDKVPTFGKSRYWQMGSVNKILANPAVIGEFQMFKTVGGRRVPHGDPVSNYFPKAVKRELFYAAQASRVSRRTNGGGRRGSNISNLFAKIAECAYCGGKMMFEDKGAPPKGGTYLTCMNSKAGVECLGARWKYQDFETSFLAFVEELDLGSLLTSDKDAALRAAREEKLNSLNGELLTVEQEREAAFSLHRSGISLDFVGVKMRACDAKANVLKSQMEEVRKAIDEDMTSIRRHYESKETLHDLIARVRNKEGDDPLKERALIAARLRVLIKQLQIFSVGYKKVGENIKKSLANGDIEPELVEEFENLLKFHEMPESNFPHFEVTFHNGVMRSVYVDPENPLKFRKQFIGDESDVEFIKIEPDGTRSKVPTD